MSATRSLLNRVARRMIAGIVTCFLAAASNSHAVAALDHATVTVETANGTSTAPASQVALPYHWNKEQGGVSGKAHFRLRLEANPDRPPQALFIRRIGNSFDIAMNGERIAQGGIHGDPYTDTSTLPRFITIPSHLLRADNVIDITIGAVSSRPAGVGLVYAGTEAEMREMYEESLRWRNSSYLVIMVISTVLGALAFLLWLRQREDLYLYYWVSELLWAVRLADLQIEVSPLPWPWWGIVSAACYALAPGFICKFSLTLIERHDGWRKRILDAQLFLSVPVIALALLGNFPALVSVWLGITILVCIFVAALVIRQGLRASSTEQRVLAIAVIVTCIAAVRDMIVFRILHHYGGYTWLGFAWAGFGICLAWIIAERIHKATQSIARMNQDLASRLAQREAELSAMFKARAATERSQAIVEERQRIMRDMHDGLGSQLVSAVHLARNLDVPRNMLATHLQDALDNIKLTVDAMQDTEGDIAMLLGALRYRLAPRLGSIGIALTWDVMPLPLLPDWTLHQSRQLQLIMSEAISNVISHARATRAHLSARYSKNENGEEICISLSDDGMGFDLNSLGSSSGKGMENMRARAASIGASIRLHSSSDGTRLDLTLPVAARVDPE